jgi:hypothetical protein
VAPDKDITGYMDPQVVAEQILLVLKSDKSISPAELVLERA